MMSEDNSRYELIDELVESFVSRCRLGERPSIEEYAERYPDVASELRDLLPAVAAVEQSEGDAEIPSAAISNSAVAEGPVKELGDYQIIREIGRGGMGIVYEARQISLNRHVALKTLPFAAVLDQRLLKRFKNEAMAAAQLKHSNIVSVFAVGCERGIHFYAMEYIEGNTLADVIRNLRDADVLHAKPDLSSKQLESDVSDLDGDETTSPSNSPGSNGSRIKHRSAASTIGDLQAAISTQRSVKPTSYWRTIAQFIIEVAEALDYAHNEGIVHRDIKPSNLILDAGGRVWVTDFGLARIQSDPGVTASGDLIGTLRYMSPEQVLAKRVVIDHRTDIYSLGATLYELMTLRPAFPSDQRQELLRQITLEDPRPPRRINKSVPAELETIAVKAMAKNPVDRYESAQHFADDLRRFINDEPIQARRPTKLQQTQKWARRHQAIVTSAAVSLAVLLVLAIVGTGLVAAKERQRRVASEEAKALAVKMQRQTEATNQEISSLLGSSFADRAQTLCEQGEIGQGILWFDRSLKVTPEQNTDLQQTIRLNLAAWRRHCHRMIQAVQLDSEISTVAVSPDGAQFLSAESNRTVQLWNATTAETVGPPIRVDQDIHHANFSPDGKRFVLAGSSGEVQLYNTKTLDKQGDAMQHSQWFPPDFRGDGGSTSLVTAIAFSPDGSRVATATKNGMAQEWDASTGRPIGAPFKHDGRGEIRSLRYCANGLVALVTIGQEHQRYQLWNVVKREPAGGVIDSRMNPSATAIHPDGTKFITGNYEAVVWDATTGETTLPPILHGGMIISLAISHDGSQIASAGADHSARIWNAKTGQPSGGPIRHSGYVKRAFFDGAGRHLLTASSDGSVRMFELASSGASERVIQHDDPIVLAAFSPDGLRIVTETNDGFQMLDEATGNSLGLPFAHPSGARLMRFSSDGASVLLRAGRVWLRETDGTEPSDFLPFKDARDATFSPDGSRILVGCRNGDAMIFDSVTRRQIGPKMKHENVVSSVAFSPDGTVILTGDFDGMVRLWDSATLTAIDPPLRNSSEVTSAAFSPSGSCFAAGFSDGTVRIWNAETRELKGAPAHHQNVVCGMAFSPDGSRLVACSIDGTARIWDTATLSPIGMPMRFQANNWPVASLNADGSQILLASSNREANVIWDAPPGPIRCDDRQLDVWAQVFTGMELKENGSISVLEVAAWKQQWNQLQKLGGIPKSQPLPPPAQHSESDVSRAMSFAQRGRRSALQKQWDQAIADFGAAIRLAGNSPMMRAQIAEWTYETSKTTYENPAHAEALRAFNYAYSLVEGLATEYPRVPEYDLRTKFLTERLQVYAGQNQWDLAEADLNAARKLHADTSELRNLNPNWVNATIVPPDSTWKWLHPTDGTDPASKAEDFHQRFFLPEFDDSHWDMGKDSFVGNEGFGFGKGFGYGDRVGVDIGMPPIQQRYSAYFRHEFDTKEAFDFLVLSMQRDDGVIVYLDGVEITRDNMPNGPDAYQLLASESAVPEWRVLHIGLPGTLQPGHHVLAISLHNSDATSSDLRIARVTLVGRGVGSSTPTLDDGPALASRARAYSYIEWKRQSATDWLHASLAFWNSGQHEEARAAHQQALEVLNRIRSSNIGKELAALRDQVDAFVNEKP